MQTFKVIFINHVNSVIYDPCSCDQLFYVNFRNPTPGIVINHPNGTDVYGGVKIDYRGEVNVFCIFMRQIYICGALVCATDTINCTSMIPSWQNHYGKFCFNTTYFMLLIVFFQIMLYLLSVNIITEMLPPNCQYF